MNPFERHGVKHLSPSSLNLWREAPGLWTVRYLNNVKDDGNAAMWRGSAVEDGLKVLLHGGNLAAAQVVALQAFDLNAAGELSDVIEAERALINPMVHQCLLWNKPAPVLASQLKVEHWFDGIPIPVIGYLDFALEGDLDVDLKTTKRCPSEPSANHLRQVALYRKARMKRGALLYVTDKRHAFYEVSDDDAERALNDLESDALSLMQFLSRIDNPKQAAQCLPMNTESFFWSDKTKAALSEILLAG